MISIWSILVVILMLGLLVTIHELGHFWAACLLRIRAFEVSIFVGPKLFSWKRNGVEYSIRALPFGAYVRFSDIDDEGNVINSEDPDLLLNQKRWKRLLVALAGPFMNAVLGIVLFMTLFMIDGYWTLKATPVYEDTQLALAIEANGENDPFTVGDTVTHVNGHRLFTYLDFFYEVENGVSIIDDMTITLRSQDTGESYSYTLTPTIEKRPMLGVTHYEGTENKYGGWEIASVSDEQNNGDPILKPGDFLIKVDGKNVSDEDFEEFFMSLNEGDSMHLTYVRNGKTYEDDCIKTMINTTNDRGIRVFAARVNSVASFFDALKTASLMPFTICNVSIRAIGDVFKGEEEVYNMVSGPVGVTTIVSDVVDNVDDSASTKALNVLQLAAIISIGLMFTNMLPIPGLDGVQVILIIVEMVIGRPLSKKTENIINVIGFILLLALVIFAFASDIIRIIVGR